MQVHDIEDLCRVGRQVKACAYFASRKFAGGVNPPGCARLQPGTWQQAQAMMTFNVYAAEEAELVFTPYNYLLDPVIRAAMKVDIKHAVLIFDEAHNIEDICRCAHALNLSCERAALGESRVSAPGLPLLVHFVSFATKPLDKEMCTGGMCICAHACREAASAEVEHRTMMDARSALEQMALFGKNDLYGPLADGLGRCVCLLHCTWVRPMLVTQRPSLATYNVLWCACRVCEWLSMRAERPDVRQQGGAQRYEGVWGGSQVSEGLLLQTTLILPLPT